MVRRLGIVPRGDGDNGTSLLFPNGSRIVIDEAARTPDSLYKALRPMLAVDRAICG